MTKETRNLILFFVATFIWTWAFYAPIAISGSSPYNMPWMVLLILGGAGPSIVGLAMVFITHDKGQRRDYWRRCFSLRRVGPAWWAVIFFIFPLVFAVSIGVDMATGGPLPGIDQLKSLIATPGVIPLAAFLSFLSGPWSEEFGWRGFALDPLLKRFGPVSGSIVLGVVWAVWHFPLFLMPATWHGKMGFQLAGFWTFIVFSVGLSLIITWVYQNTDRSILAGMLLHFTSNFTAQLLATTSNQVEMLRAVLLLAVGLAACGLMARKAGSREAREVDKSLPGDRLSFLGAGAEEARLARDLQDQRS
jgi:membrane protease YdiL (CAAX protease family)